MRSQAELNDLRQRAIALRREGKSRREIKAILGPMSNSTLNDALAGEPPPDWTRRPRAKDGLRAAERAARAASRDAECAAAAAGIGALTEREILIADAIAYWCEGTKRKPHRSTERVVFMNSDPDLIRFFLRFLCAAGVPRSDLAFGVYIHESADVTAAEQFWLEVTGATRGQFQRPALKRHNPRPTGRTSATTITAACASPCIAAARSTARSKAG
jgi:hypothetical protein